jgi:hypothetical protein
MSDRSENCLVGGIVFNRGFDADSAESLLISGVVTDNAPMRDPQFVRDDEPDVPVNARAGVKTRIGKRE